jgi:VCBS repeat-containing protein
VQVAQQSFNVPNANHGSHNNVVTFTDPGFNSVDKVVFSLTNSGGYYHAYQYIDNIALPNTVAQSIDINVLANDTDVDSGAHLSVHSFSGFSAHGAAISLNANGTLHYDPTVSVELQALSQGTHVYDSFTYQAQDQFGALSNQASVGINVTGSNDAPVMQTQNVSRALAEDGASPDLTASGLAQFSDADLSDNHTISATLASTALSSGGSLPASLSALLGSAMVAQMNNPSQDDGHGQIQWDFALANGATQFLAAGQTLTLGYDVKATDTFGATATQRVSVTITGTNDAASISGNSTGAVTEDTTLSTSGTLAVADVDQSQAVFQAQTGVAGTYGSFSIGADGNWTYALDNSAANVQLLNTADHPSDNFTVLSQDGTASQLVTVSVSGLDEPQLPPVLHEPQLQAVADFESFTTNTALPNGYSGFNWPVLGNQQLLVVNGENRGSGFAVATSDNGSMVAVLQAFKTLSITRSNGGDFVFNSVELTAVSVAMNVTLTGYNNGIVVGTVPSANFSSAVESTVTADWGYIDQLEIKTIAVHTNSYLILDDFTYFL